MFPTPKERGVAMDNTSILTPSQEDYLEAIANIIAEKKVARTKEISSRLKVRASSVSGALSVLADLKLIHYRPYEVITLTPKGEEIAAIITSRHALLKDFFINILKANPAEAEGAACGMEHSISADITVRLAALVQCLKSDTETLRTIRRCVTKNRNVLEKETARK
jgi:DtxR family Mn-dependent transcriptional regulator